MDEKTKELVEGAEARAKAAPSLPWWHGRVGRADVVYSGDADDPFPVIVWDPAFSPLPGTLAFLASSNADVRALCAIVREQAAQLELLANATKVGAGETLVLVADKGMTTEGRKPAAEALYGVHPSPIIVPPHGWSAIQVDELCRTLERAEAGIS